MRKSRKCQKSAFWIVAQTRKERAECSRGAGPGYALHLTGNRHCSYHIVIPIHPEPHIGEDARRKSAFHKRRTPSHLSSRSPPCFRQRGEGSRAQLLCTPKKFILHSLSLCTISSLRTTYGQLRTRRPPPSLQRRNRRMGRRHPRRRSSGHARPLHGRHGTLGHRLLRRARRPSQSQNRPRQI